MSFFREKQLEKRKKEHQEKKKKRESSLTQSKGMNSARSNTDESFDNSNIGKVSLVPPEEKQQKTKENTEKSSCIC